LTLGIIVFARDHNEIQIILLLILSVIFQALIIGSRPMIEKTNQNMSVFNEVATSIYLYITILLTEFMGETGMRDQFGWALLFLVGGVVAVNFLRVIYNVPSFLKSVYMSVKGCFKKDTDTTVSIRPTKQATD
jgi:hypothetical protein